MQRSNELQKMSSTGALLLTHQREKIGQDLDENNEAKFATPSSDAHQYHKDCEGVPDGAYQYANTKNCSDFYRCESQKLINCTCGSRYVFDARTQSCVFGSQTQPCLSNFTISCTDSNNGGFHLVANTQCKRYFQCRDYHRIDYQCSHDQIFDLEALSCTTNKRITCSDTRHSSAVVQRSQDCDNKPDGKYSIHSDEITFYVCKNRRKVSEGSCQEQQIFVEKLQRCVTLMQSDKLSSDDNKDRCSDRPDGYFGDVRMQCRKFYNCKNGQKLNEKECPEETLFDLAKGLFQRYDKVACPQQTSKMVSHCTDQTDGYHKKPSLWCNKFIVCVNGQNIAELMCGREKSTDNSSKQYYDDGSTECLKAEQYVLDENEDCLGKENGVYHPNLKTNCQSFFFCKDGFKIRELSCQEGYIFDYLTKSCQPTGNASCIDTLTRNASCSNKVDGIYSDVAIEYKGFYQCKNGRIISEIDCQTGQIFDEASLECRPRHELTCLLTYQNSHTTTNEEPLENMCRSKNDGFYPNYSTGCRRYYHCRQFQKMTEYMCTAGQLFDPISSRCLPETSVNCSTAILQMDVFDTCRIKEDGYYPNYSNGCYGYYYCRDRTKIVDLMCPPGKLFEVTKGRCSDKTTVTCITSKHDSHEVSPFDTSLSTEIRSSFNCLKKFDGLYPDIDEGCSQYYVCVNSQLIKTGKCPDGQLFDTRGQSCRPASQVLFCNDNKHDDQFVAQNSSLQEASLHFHFGSECRNTTVCFENINTLPLYCSSLLSAKNDGQKHRVCKIGGLSEMRHKKNYDVLASYNCKEKEDGYYTDPDSHCRKWHLCKGGLGTTHECDSGKVFNILHRRCDPSQSVVCANQSWVYRIYSSERSFPSYSTLNTTKSSITGISNQCLHKSDGIYIDLERHFSKSPTCFSVILCLQDKTYDVSCPFKSQELEWDVKCGLTDGLECIHDNASTVRAVLPNEQHRNQFLQTETLTQAVASATIPLVSSIQPPEFSCKNQSNGFYEDRTSSCRTFHICVNGCLKSNTCVKPLLFDSITKTCEFPEKVHCPLHTTNVSGSHWFPFAPCLSNLTRLHPDVTTLCQSYFGCIGEQFQYGECPPNKLFDKRTVSCNPKIRMDVKCITPDTFNPVDSMLHSQPCISDALLSPLSVDTFAANSFDCTNKPDGFYPDYHQSCHVFYRCIQGRKFSHYCKLGQLFNMQIQSCDFKENVKCEAVKS